MSVMYAVKVAGPRHDAPDVYWKEPLEKRRALLLRARPGGGKR